MFSKNSVSYQLAASKVKRLHIDAVFSLDGRETGGVREHEAQVRGWQSRIGGVGETERKSGREDPVFEPQRRRHIQSVHSTTAQPPVAPPGDPVVVWFSRAPRRVGSTVACLLPVAGKNSHGVSRGVDYHNGRKEKSADRVTPDSRRSGEHLVE
ncbi:hypothetical protein MRX96_042748 [Rhipicephalus microplus]